MPVSISFLNALSGMSTSMAGFMMSNEALVVSGAFICCSGIILTLVMCKNIGDSVTPDIEAPKPRKKTHKKVKSEDPFLRQMLELQSHAFLKVGVVKEPHPNENRVAITPDQAKRLLKSGIKIVLETNAGIGSALFDSAYATVGCTIVDSAQQVFGSADAVLKIREPVVHPETAKHEIDMMKEGTTLICPVAPQTESGKMLLDKAKEHSIKGIEMKLLTCLLTTSNSIPTNDNMSEPLRKCNI